SGIWPPSKPCTWLPVRALAPLTPRPEVLPRPEDEPRPSLALRLCAPGLLAIWLSFILLALFHHFDEVLDGVDHAAHGGRVFQGAGAADFAETQATQDGGLDVGLAVGAAYLAHRHRLPGFRFLLGHDFSLLPCIRIPRRSGLRGGPGFPPRCGHGAGPPYGGSAGSSGRRRSRAPCCRDWRCPATWRPRRPRPEPRTPRALGRRR